MGYKMNIGNELAQIKKCKDIDEIEKFLTDHNLKLDHWYLEYSASQFAKDQKGLYVIASYENDDGTFIQITFYF